MITMAMMMTAIILPLPALATGGADGLLDSFIPLRSQPCLARTPGPRRELGRGGLSEKPEGTVLRRLRPTVSELGEVDAAAIEEAKRRLTFVYQITDNTCLVEADEEPPHEATRDALDTALLVSLMLDAEPVREVHFMRKLVIDGSNTTGFQRSALIAVDGAITVDGKRVGILTTLPQEDVGRQDPPAA